MIVLFRGLRMILVILLLLSGVGLLAAQDATPTSAEPETYVIQPGDSLLSIARRFNTTVTALVQENNIANPEIIYWGQRIRIPGTVAATATPLPDTVTATITAAPLTETDVPAALSETPLPIEPTATEIVLSGPAATFGYGIEANLYNQDVEALASTLDDLGVEWVKQIVYWRDLEPNPGEIDFATLDDLVVALQLRNIKILLTVTAAPDWARSIREEDGPPDDFSTYGSFMSALATRYAGRVAAYQIWNEPNLRNRWKSTVYPISPASYVDLLETGYNAVKAADSQAIVVSAGLAVTGFNDALNAEAGDLAVNAVDDRVYLAGMYAEGLAAVSDAVGAHPIGWANPPDAVCCAPAEGVATHYENRSFYFQHTLEDYRQIQIANGDASTPVWVTRFAWGTSEDIGQPDAANIFTSYTDLLEQARYTMRAYEIGAASGFVGPMFAYNLNSCQAPGRDGFSSCYYSFIGPSGAPRPVFGAVQLVINNTVSAATATMMPTQTLVPDSEITPEMTAEATMESSS